MDTKTKVANLFILFYIVLFKVYVRELYVILHNVTSDEYVTAAGRRMCQN